MPYDIVGCCLRCVVLEPQNLGTGETAIEFAREETPTLIDITIGSFSILTLMSSEMVACIAVESISILEKMLEWGVLNGRGNWRGKGKRWRRESEGIIPVVEVWAAVGEGRMVVSGRDGLGEGFFNEK
ncbi:hypothetical protein NE237_001105 [Protea cynaroides]|uniref:Uncharacterized protein n=1 Tax=Protea cynaroides TaxID=273540 RepID=A0A9Q0KTH5_9MAGN|nr:hypothetical protein NE237_001105 [Protea cynaroides]